MFKVAALALFPVPVCVGLVSVGLVLLWFTRRQILGKGLVTVGFGLLALASNPMFADWVISGLEGQYPALRPETGMASRTLPERARYVVVLAGALNPAEGLPPTSRLGSAMLMRLTEGIRLHWAIPESTLVLSGGSERGETEAAAMAELAVMLGVARDSIIIETRSLTTYEQAQRVKEIVGASPIILVTSASHMPRAMRLFRNAGMHPIAAPTDHLRGNVNLLVDFIPSSASLATTSAAFYEALAFLKAKVLGRI